MTREEAISEWTVRRNHIKKWLDENGEEPSMRHDVELIDIAIEALSEPRGDLISREDAIDAICKSWCYVTYMDCPHADDGFRCDGCDDIEAIEALPSAENSNAKAQNSNQQTQKSNGDLIYRADAIQTFIRWGQKEFGFSDLNREERFIDAINALPSALADIGDYADRLWKIAYERGKAEAEAVPLRSDCAECSLKAINRKLDEESYEKGYTAGQFADRPKGLWTITTTDDGEGGEVPHLICSVCGNEPTAWSSRQFFNFCPNCGARMKGGTT